MAILAQHKITNKYVIWWMYFRFRLRMKFGKVQKIRLVCEPIKLRDGNEYR